MSVFYFNFRTGEQIEQDEEGLEFPNLNEAREEAISTAREIVSNAVRDGRGDAPDHIVIADADGRELAIIALADMVPARLRR